MSSLEKTQILSDLGYDTRLDIISLYLYKSDSINLLGEIGKMTYSSKSIVLSLSDIKLPSKYSINYYSTI